MMPLALMKRFLDTVTSEGRSPLADQMIARWFQRGANARAYRSSANFVFKASAAESGYFLRFNHASEREVPFLEAECRFLKHLAESGVRVNLPIPSAAGRFVESVETEMGIFHALLFDAIPGKHREIEDLDLAGFEAWGKLVGEIHAASQGFATDGRPAWADLVSRARGWLSKAESATRDELDRVEQAVQSRSFTSASYGLIHYDLELDNILWGEHPGVIDFDDCAYYPFAADIASALRDLWGARATRIDFGDERLLMFIRGYRGAHTLEDAEVRSLPLYVRLHDLLMFAKLIRSLAEPTPNAPAWVDKLRAKLEGVLERKRGEFRDALPEIVP